MIRDQIISFTEKRDLKKILRDPSSVAHMFRVTREELQGKIQNIRDS